MPHGAVPFPFGYCRICNDKATGFHYGVATCEGCKGFFKRSILKGDKYTCFFEDQCQVTPFNRNRCKACRFKRCLDNGMALDAVKMGRIPKLEKERALMEAGFQNNLSFSMDIDTEKSLFSSEPSSDTMDIDTEQSLFSSQSINNTVNSDETSLKESLKLSLQPNESNYKESFEKSTQEFQCCSNETLASRAQIFSGPDWKSQQRNWMSSKYDSRQQGFECLQGLPPHSWTPESARAHDNSLQGMPRNISVKDNLLSSVTTPTAPSTFYNDQITSQTNGGHTLPLCDKQFSLKSESYTQDNILFSKKPSVANPTFPEISEVKTEPEVQEFNNCFMNKKFLCDNPFAQPSFSLENQIMEISDYPTPLTDIVGAGVFEYKPDSFYTHANIIGKCSKEEMTVRNTSESRRTHKRSSCEVVEYKEYYLSKTKMSTGIVSSKNKEHDIKTSNSRKSCYSPDVIKVLMDQVGEERIKEIKQQVMTTVAKSFGPDEYEATKQLFKSYTQSSEEKKSLKLGFLQHHHNNRHSNLSGNQECGDLSLGTCQNFSLQSPVCSIAASSSLYNHRSPETVASFMKLSQDHNILHSRYPVTKAENPCIFHHSFNEHQEENLLENVKNMELSNELNPTQYLDTSLETKDFEFHDVADLYDNDVIDTSGVGFSNSGCSAATLFEPFFKEEFAVDTATKTSKNVRESVTSSTGIQNLSSDKDCHSPDSSCLVDLTMAESAMTLLAAYDQNMEEVVRKHKRMMDYIQNKKALPVHPLTPEGQAKVYNNLISSIPVINQSIIGFSQGVPGFTLLPKEDKEILMKRGYYDIWMLINSKLFHADESYLQLDDGTFYTRAFMEAILNVPIVEKFIAFTKKFNALALSDLEIAILCAVQLTSPSHDQSDLTCNETIQQMNSNFVDLLVQEVSKKHPSNCSRILVDIFRLMPDLAEINLMQREIIASFSTSEPPEKVVYKPKTLPMADLSDKDLAALTDD